MDEIRYQIERIGKNGRLTGMAWHYGFALWVPVSRIDASIATRQGAEAICQEWDLEIGLEVEITEHCWPAAK